MDCYGLLCVAVRRFASLDGGERGIVGKHAVGGRGITSAEAR